MSHTRGPWTYNDYSGRVRGPEGNTIADCRYKNGKIDGPLIAAAPELLEALREAKEFIENLQLLEKEWARVLDKSVAAIKKATDAA